MAKSQNQNFVSYNPAPIPPPLNNSFANITKNNINNDTASTSTINIQQGNNDHFPPLTYGKSSPYPIDNTTDSNIGAQALESETRSSNTQVTP